MRLKAQKTLLRQMFDAAIASVQPAVCIPHHLPEPPQGKTLIVGAGKASAEMARVFEATWPSPLSGVVVTRYGYAADCERIQILEAAHPTPDEAGVLATRQIMQTVSDLTEEDLVVALISGGGSALLTYPPKPLNLADKLAVNQALLDSGAPIHAINCVRKHLSLVKGGRLILAAAPARVVTLLISDVPGDDPATIASGPTVPDPTTRQQALEIIRQYQVPVPTHILEYLASPVAESPKPNDALFARCTTRIIAAPGMMLKQAAKIGVAAGYRVSILGDNLEGEAREVARKHAELAVKAQSGTILLSGGELTVTHPGHGEGGPNTEYALALAKYLDGRKSICAIACDTDGIDGSGENAGAYIDPTTLSRARQLGLPVDDYLDAHNAAVYFRYLDDLVISGPTRTNVNDFRAILIAH
jgi:glycerate 2-kinase